MEIDRRAFLATLGSTAVINRIPDEEKAEALEHYMTDLLDQQATGNELIVRRGTGDLFGSAADRTAGSDWCAASGQGARADAGQADAPRLLQATASRRRRTCSRAQPTRMKKGEKEETVLACLMHDVVLNLIKVDHGWWGAQMIEPYVSGEGQLGDPPSPGAALLSRSVGRATSIPSATCASSAKDYVPAPYIKTTYEYARKHKWYMEARMITVHDLYAFRAGREGVARSVRRHHRPALQAAERRPGLRRQPGRAHVADDDVPGSSSLVDGRSSLVVGLRW